MTTEDVLILYFLLRCGSISCWNLNNIVNHKTYHFYDETFIGLYISYIDFLFNIKQQ